MTTVRPRVCWRLLPLLAVLAWPAAAPGQDMQWFANWFPEPGASRKQIEEDEKFLRDAQVRLDDAALLDFLRQRVLAPADEQKIRELFDRLDARTFQEREKATTELIAVGPRAVPVLRTLLQGQPTLEVRMRAERCLKALDGKAPPAHTAAVVRLLKARQTKGACAVLLEFAPFAPDEMVADELLDAVYTLGVRGGRLDPAVVAALRDPNPGRRTVAALLVGRFGDDAQRRTVAELLDDKDANVRFRAAQGLVARGERAALPVLVQTLKDAPYDLAERAEEMLLQAAGKDAPKAALGVGEGARVKAYEAWKGWLDAHGRTVDLTKVDLGLPLAGPTQRAREVCQQFLDLSFKNDKANIAKIRRLVDLPFYMAGQKIINTQEEWDAQMNQQQQAPDGFKFKMTLGKILPLDQYLQMADQQEKDFLAKYPRAEVRVVDLKIELDAMDQKLTINFGLYVRVNAARARLFGLGMPRMSDSFKK